MTAGNRVSIIWPLLILVGGVLWLLQALGTLPPVVLDLIQRAWPMLLILLGLMLLLGRRIRFGNVIAMVACVALVGGVTITAYSQQSGKTRTDNIKPLNQPIEANVKSVKIQINALTTEIEINAASGKSISGQFSGSKESKIASDYQVDGDVGTFTFVETPGSTIPSLEAVGRGKLALTIPKDVTIDQLTLNGGNGPLDLDASGTTIKNLAITVGAGDVTVHLPDKPGLIADIKTGQGNAAIEVPKNIAGNIILRGGGSGNPEFNGADYTLSIDRVLVSKRSSNPQMQVSVDAPGKITIN